MFLPLTGCLIELILLLIVNTQRKISLRAAELLQRHSAMLWNLLYCGSNVTPKQSLSRSTA